MKSEQGELARKSSAAESGTPVIYELRSVNLTNLPEKEQASVLYRFESILDTLTDPIKLHIVQDETEVESIGAAYQIPYKRFFLETGSQDDPLVRRLGTRMARAATLPVLEIAEERPKYLRDSDGLRVQVYCVTRLGGSLDPGFMT